MPLGQIPLARLTGGPPEPFVSPELPEGYCQPDISRGFDTALPSHQTSANEADLNRPLVNRVAYQKTGHNISFNPDRR